MRVKISPDFENLLPDPSTEELAQMEANIIAHPEAFPPIVIWANHHNTLIEGHWRYKLFVKNGLNPKFLKMKFANREEALAYAVRAQAGRRNIGPGQLAMLLTKHPPLAIDLKSTANGGASISEIAKELGVTKRTVSRARMVRKKAPPATITSVERGEKSLNKAESEIKRPEVDKPQKSGAIRNDPKDYAIVHTQIGGCVRAIERLNGAHPAEKFYRESRKSLEALLTTVKEWQRALN
jgi:hypothetical protein